MNRKGTKPIYIQLQEYVKQNIETGTYKPGQLLPSEREFSEMFGISRMTVRQAIQGLVGDGLVIKEHGRGMFVARRTIEKDNELQGFSEDMIKLGFKPDSKTLEFIKIYATEKHSKQLEVEVGEPVYFIKRLRLADGMPMAIEYVYVPAKYVENLEKYNLEHCSLYEVMKTDYKIEMMYAQQSIMAKKLTKSDARLLLRKESGFGLFVNRRVFDRQNRLIEYGETYYHPERYQFSLTVDKK